MNIVASSCSNASKIPSRATVNLTCSEPGLIPNSALVLSPFSTACFAIDAALDKSSYEELVQEPINPHSTFVGQSFEAAATAISETGVAKSGVKGPLTCGANSDKFISIT